MMRRLRFVASWALFGLGDAVSRAMNLTNWLGHLYPVYSRLMQASSALQRKGEAGPWKEV